MRKLGMNMLGYQEGITLEDRARMFHDHGFGAIFTGIQDSAEQLAEITEIMGKKDISIDSLHAPFRGINEIWLDTDEGKQMLDTLKTSVDRCLVANAPILVVHLSSGLTPPPTTDLGRGRFIELVEYAASKNVKIAFENQRKLANLAWAFEEFDQAENVGFCWDCGHEYSFTLGREYMPLFGKKLICTHIHDNDCDGRDMHMIPFDGKIPFDVVAKHIKDSGYKGTLMLETFPIIKEDVFLTYEGYTIEQYIARAAQAGKKLLAMIDGE
ncbi:MAG: sugar phosphate isomerase/epimerase [Clostridia bacterium]|nr:sugar phosphate isomerase/epimerase [Clostridia bacterium]